MEQFKVGDLVIGTKRGAFNHHGVMGRIVFINESPYKHAVCWDKDVGGHSLGDNGAPKVLEGRGEWCNEEGLRLFSNGFYVDSIAMEASKSAFTSSCDTTTLKDKKQTIMNKVSNFAKKLINQELVTLIEAGLIDQCSMQLTGNGKEKLCEILFQVEANKAALVEAAKEIIAEQEKK